MSSPAAFPTFCHISEYGDAGYAHLHRMLAISQPLILWAPSSVSLLRASQLGAREIVDYVEAGSVRVHARVPWLTDRAFRAKSDFEGARWNPEIDDPLRSIYEEDLGRPISERRVFGAPPEQGWLRADEFLDSNAEAVTRWYRIFRSRNAAEKLPVGVVETAAREAGKTDRESDIPRNVARAILRDAFNHSEAFRDSGAQVPFLLSANDRRFLELISRQRRSPNTRRSPALDPPVYDVTSSALAGQLLDLLRHLDLRRGRQDLREFMKGEGHQQLTQWLSAVCDRLTRTDARIFDREVIGELRAQMNRATLSSPVRELIQSRLALGAGIGGAVGVVSSAVDIAVNLADPLSATSFAASVFALGYGALRQFQYVPTTFDGPQWPFLYTYGARANRRRLANMRYLLEQFRVR